MCNSRCDDQVTDTNASWLGKFLHCRGIDVCRIEIVGDCLEEIQVKAGILIQSRREVFRRLRRRANESVRADGLSISGKRIDITTRMHTR